LDVNDGVLMEVSNYKHKIIAEVKFHEVDMLGVCNNAVYFNYYEDARIKYLYNLKHSFNLNDILEKNYFFLMAHNECDYIESAHLYDELNIYTRIEYIKNSSFGFRHIVENNKLKKVIARGGGVFVFLDIATKKSSQLPEEFYEAVQKYEPLAKIIKK
jgi:acyl-CoA thioester hydrolase